MYQSITHLPNTKLCSTTVPKLVHECAYRHVDIMHGYPLSPPAPLWLGTPEK